MIIIYFGNNFTNNFVIGLMYVKLWMVYLLNFYSFVRKRCSVDKYLYFIRNEPFVILRLFFFLEFFWG